jgi:RNA polymerase sigma-70 factor (ECF subfamily)
MESSLALQVQLGRPQPNAVGSERSFPSVAASEGSVRIPDVRLREIFSDHFAFVWRVLRRLGLQAADADDAAQSVFIIAAQKRELIEAGKERGFLSAVALRVVLDVRKKTRRRREELSGAVEMLPMAPTQEQRLEDQEARKILDDILEGMPLDLRAVFVLFELEQLSAPEIAVALDIPVGTVASRLRRARESFERAVQRFRLRMGEST